MRKFLDRLQQIILGLSNANKLLFTLLSVSIFLFFLTLSFLINHENPSRIITLLLLDLISLLLVIVVATRKILIVIFKDYKTSRIRARIILMFSIIAAIPTIIVSSFSVIVFDIGLQSWFDSKVSTAIEQSVRVADLYISENKNQLKEAAFSISTDLRHDLQLLHNPALLNSVLEARADLRSLSEAIIFHKPTNTVLAQTALSFSLSFLIIPQHLYDKANEEIVEVPSDTGKLRMLIKLKEFDETYLLVGRLIDEEILNYIDKTNGAASKYNEMVETKNSFRVKFALLFILVSGTLIACTITVGAIFANKIARPIRKLVRATELVQSGDLSVQVEIDQSKEDELVILTNAFNKMVKKIEIQQKDLALVQRTMAWSDVARRVAHEIKNPLTPISLCADRILKKFLPEINDKESLQKYINIIKRHTRDIQTIITEFGEFAKMPAPNFEQVELVSLLRDLIESRQIINDKIIYNFCSEVENIDFVCDTTQIHQLMVNLLKNAEEALESSSVTKKHINLSLILSNDELEIIVEDNGKGFPPDLIDKVTEAYMTTRSKGSGLGLAIVKKIVQDHGGEILISNLKAGGGSVKLIFDREKINLKVKK